MNQEAKNFLVAVIAVVVVVGVGYFIWRQSGSSSPMAPSAGGNPPAVSGSVTVAKPLPPAPKLDAGTLAANRALVLSLAAKSKLTADEKSQILNLLGGNKVQQYNFTAAEMKKILDAVNK